MLRNKVPFDEDFLSKLDLEFDSPSTSQTIENNVRVSSILRF